MLHWQCKIPGKKGTIWEGGNSQNMSLHSDHYMMCVEMPMHSFVALVACMLRTRLHLSQDA